MGQFVDGVWTTSHVTHSKDGSFQRKATTIRDWIRADGSTPFAPEAGRYHLYVSTACPWCHRTRIALALKGLEHVVAVHDVEPLMLEHGWVFSDRYPDPLYGFERAGQLYTKHDAKFTGRVTLPVLWDAKTERMVNNESSEIIRMFGAEFQDLAKHPELEPYPADLRAAIDDLNDRVYNTVNNGVYRSGFAGSQEAYSAAVTALFDSLDWLEERLAGGGPWLFGDRLTEADIRLYPTLIRFDAVYHGHFKCNLRQLRDYPALFMYTRRFHALAGVRDTFDIDYTKTHYYGSHRSLNPKGIVPAGPVQEWM